MILTIQQGSKSELAIEVVFKIIESLLELQKGYLTFPTLPCLKKDSKMIFHEFSKGKKLFYAIRFDLLIKYIIQMPLGVD